MLVSKYVYVRIFGRFFAIHSGLSTSWLLSWANINLARLTTRTLSAEHTHLPDCASVRVCVYLTVTTGNRCTQM